MVKILPNGEIVPDSDPRANSRTNRSSNGTPTSHSRRQGFIQTDEHHPEQQEGDGLHGQPRAGEGRNVVADWIDSSNNRLIAAGFPRFHIGPYAVEPIVSVGTLLAGLLLGLPGIIFAALLFLICKWSQSGSNVPSFLAGSRGGQTDRSDADGHRSSSERNRRSRNPWSNTQSLGQRLGRS